MGVLPDLVEDVPKAPMLVGQLAGSFIASERLTFGLLELAAAAKDAGADRPSGGGADDDEEEPVDPPLVDGEAAGPMLLAAANAIKVRRGAGHGAALAGRLAAARARARCVAGARGCRLRGAVC